MCGTCLPDLQHFANVALRGAETDPMYEQVHREHLAQIVPSIRPTPSETTLFSGKFLTLANHAFSAVKLLVVDKSGTIRYSGNDHIAASAVAAVDGVYVEHDFGDATILPGFVEPHVHLVFSALARSFLDLSPITRTQISEVTDAIAAQVPVPADPAQWICGFGYDPSRMPHDGYPDLTRQIVDEVAPANPVLVLNSSGHVAYINSAAFDSMVKGKLVTWDQINASNDYEKDGNNLPNGVIFEKAIATLTNSGLIPFPSDSVLIADVQNVLQDWLAKGVTTIFDGGIGVTGLDRHIWPLLRPTPMRLRGALATTARPPWPVSSDTNWDLGDQVRVTSAKFWADGSTQGYTALLKDKDPSPPPWAIPDFPSAGKLRTDMAPWYDAGFQLVVHANGDQATANVLDAYTNLFEKEPVKEVFVGKHRIDHFTVVEESQIEHMATDEKLKDRLSVSHTIGHVYYWGDAFQDHIFHTNDGSDKRAVRIDPIADDIKNELLWSMHSDSPVTPVDPLLYVRTALTRLTRISRTVLGFEQRVTDLVAALEAVTVNPAIQLGIFEQHESAVGPLAEAMVGSLKVGKQADFVVLSLNPRNGHAADIHNIPIRETWIDGLKVFPKIA